MYTDALKKVKARMFTIVLILNRKAGVIAVGRNVF